MKIEKILFYFLIFCLPIQARKILWQANPLFNEWETIFFYGTDILIGLILVLWVFRGGLKKLKIDRTLFLSVFCLAIVILLSLLKTANFNIGLYQWLKLLEFILLFFYLMQNFKIVYSLKKFFQVLVASGLLQSLIAILQFARQESLGLKLLGESPLAPNLAGVANFLVDGVKIIRAYGTFPHPNILATFLVLAIFALIYLLRSVEIPSLMKKKELFFDQALEPRRVRGAWRSSVSWFSTSHLRWVARTVISLRFLVFSGYLLSLGIILLGLFLTFSRVIILTGLLAVFLYLIFVIRKKGRVILFLGCCLLMVGLLWPFISVRFSTELVPSQAFDLRVFYNKAAIQMLKSSPLLGIGWGNFTHYSLLITHHLESWMYQPVHNIYLLVASQAGLLGLLIFLWFLFLVIKRTKIPLLLFILGFFLVIGFFDHFLLTSQQGSLMFWLVLGMMAGYYKDKPL